MAKPENKLPKLFHIGTQKAASTFLYNMLKCHPDTALSELTEINYFSSKYDKGLHWYKNCFPQNGIKIDTSPKTNHPQ